MGENKLKIYCETSFWSYLNGRPTPLQHIAIKQAATLQWWQEIAPKCEIYISQHVLDESVDGDSLFALRRTESMASAMVLDAFVPDAENLAVELMNGHAIPATEATDAAHIATAAVYGMDVLLTWNCRHMANPVSLPKTATIISKNGYICPVVITPVDFIERREEFGL